MKRSETELSALVWEQLTKATDYAQAALADVRRLSWEYYLNDPRGDEIEGRSMVQSTIIRDTHTALMSTIMPAYATDTVVQFEPHGQDDEQQAEAETCAVNNLFTESNQGYAVLRESVSDSLLFRNGIIKCWLETDVQEVQSRYEAPQAAVSAYLNEQGEDIVSIDNQDGITTAVVQRSQQKLNFQAIEPSYFGVDPNTQDTDLQDAPMIWELMYKTRNELREMGVVKSKIDKMPQVSDEGTNVPFTGQSGDRLAKLVGGQSSNRYTSNYWDQQVEVYAVHMMLDGERWYFLTGHHMILDKQRVNYFPYATGAAFPVAHRWSGLGLYDLLKQTQDSQTSLTRQLLDNMNYSNNSGMIFNPAETKAEDVSTRAPGRGVRSINPANVVPVPVTDITSQSLAALAYFDDRAGQQAGAALDMATAEAQTVKDVSGLSVEMQLAPKEQIASQVSRNIAETLVRQTFLLAHRILREEYDGALQYRKAGEWTETRPGEWQPRNRMNVAIGLSPGDRRRHKANLEMVMQMQMQDLQGGLANITVDYPGIHAARVDWMKAAEIDGAEGYFLDPESQQSQQGMQMAAAEQQEQSQMMTALQEMQVQLEQQQQQLDKYKIDQELQWKYYDTNMDAEVQEAKIVADTIKTESGSEAAPAAGGNGSDQ